MYKRNISLMDPKIFPRSSLDKPIDNPDAYNSIRVDLAEKPDKEIIDNVVLSLKKMRQKESITK